MNRKYCIELYNKETGDERTYIIECITFAEAHAMANRLRHGMPSQGGIMNSWAINRIAVHDVG